MGAYDEPQKWDYSKPFDQEFKTYFRQPTEPWDGRPVLLIRPFWRDDAEREAYERAAKDHPRVVDVEADTIESSMAYIARLASLVQRGPLPQPLKRMPMRREELVRAGVLHEPAYEARLDAIYVREPGEEG